MTISACVLLLACAGDKADPTDPVDTDPTGTPDCVASFTDGLGAEPSFTKPDGDIVIANEGYYPHLQGAVADGPPFAFHVESDRIGACRLMTWTPSSCTPECTGYDQCIDGVCVPYPERIDAGTLSVTADGVDLTVPVDATTGWFAELPAAFQGAVTASAAGAEVPAFTVGSCAVSAPAPTADWSAVLESRADGEDAVLAWVPVDPSARISLHMTTGTATHGGIAHAEIECEGPDVGSLTIPGPFLDALYAEGWSCGECGYHTLYRYRAGAVDAGGAEVRLTVRAGAYFGYIP